MSVFKLYAVTDDAGTVYFAARGYEDAIVRWRQWLITDGDVAPETAATDEPESVVKVADESYFVLPFEAPHD